MLSRNVLFAALVVSHASVHCSREEPLIADAATPSPPRTSSCDRVPAMSVCSEYSGRYLAQNEAVLSAGCGRLSGTFVGAECPNTAVLGSCVLSTGEVRKFYASGTVAYDLGRAQQACEGPYRGKWNVFK